MITYKYKSYDTAKKYVNGLREEIHGLQNSAESFQLQNRSYFSKYGLFVYRINYKRMAVIYTVHNDLVIIQRVMAANTITALYPDL